MFSSVLGVFGRLSSVWLLLQSQRSGDAGIAAFWPKMPQMGCKLVTPPPALSPSVMINLCWKTMGFRKFYPTQARCPLSSLRFQIWWKFNSFFSLLFFLIYSSGFIERWVKPPDSKPLKKGRTGLKSPEVKLYERLGFHSVPWREEMTRNASIYTSD